MKIIPAAIDFKLLNVTKGGPYRHKVNQLKQVSEKVLYGAKVFRMVCGIASSNSTSNENWTMRAL